MIRVNKSDCLNLIFKMTDFDNDGILTASDLGRLIDDLTCAAENPSKLPPEERDAVVGYVIIGINKLKYFPQFLMNNNILNYH